MKPARTKFLDPDYRRDPKTERFCCRCQKDIAGESYRRVYLRQDGITVVFPEDTTISRLPGDLGWLPIGLDCARFLEAEWSRKGPIITNAAEHASAMGRFKSLWAAEPGTSEHAELEALAEVISDWECREMERIS